MKLVVTGASSGLGEALALEAARRDPTATIGLVARRADALAALAARLPEGCAIPYPLDVTNRDALHAAGRDFVARFGAPDVVIANAGVNGPTLTGTPGDDASFERILRTNVRGARARWWASRALPASVDCRRSAVTAHRRPP